jgi:four helix bundle protein
VQDYKKITAWKASFDFIPKLYKVTQSFPENEKYGLVSQVRRAAVSVSSNIAEGAGRGSNADFVRFLDIAIGSAFEVECQFVCTEKRCSQRHSNRFGFRG